MQRSGGAILAPIDVIVVMQCRFEKCQAPNYGGAIRASRFECVATRFDSCLAKYGGSMSIQNPDGASNQDVPSLKMSGSWIINSTASDSIGGGAGIMYEGNGEATMHNCSIENCKLSQGFNVEGIICFTHDRNNAPPEAYSVSVTECVFQGNTFSSYQRGACCLQIITIEKEGSYDYSKAIVRSCTFIDNQGYAFWLVTNGWRYDDDWQDFPMEFSLIGCNFTNNNLQSKYVPVVVNSSVGVSYVNCTFQANKVDATRENGTLLFYNGAYSFSGCKFIGWETQKPVLYFPDTVDILTMKLSQCTFEDCNSGIFGSNQASNVAIEKCSFIDCSGSPAILVIQVASSFLFTGNVFNNSMVGSLNTGVLINAGNTKETILVEKCTFINLSCNNSC